MISFLPELSALQMAFRRLLLGTIKHGVKRMDKKVIILNGAARKNGNTAKLVEAFENGTKLAGNQVSKI